MPTPARHVAARHAGWLLRRPSWLLLTASDARLASEPPERFRRVWAGIMLFSLGWGVASALLWEGARNLFGLYSGSIPLMPVAVVLVAMLLGPYRRAAADLAMLVAPRRRSGPLALALVAVVLALALLGLKGWNENWPYHLPVHWQWIRPRATYRPLVLAPLWGGWAMLILGRFCRTTGKTEPAVAELIAGCGPLTAAGCMAVPLAGSLYYFNYLSWYQVGIPVATIAAATVGGGVLNGLTGGPRRCTLLAANLLTQVVFILGYLAVR